MWRFMLPVMKFDKTIAQLSFITNELQSIKTDGAVLEIGVGGGATSVIINKSMQEHSTKRRFYGIDTFYGFTKEDVDFERRFRGKVDDYLGYRSNNKKWYEKTLLAHGIHDAVVLQADAKDLVYSEFAPVAFCLLDVDLYKPVEAVLPPLYDAPAPGGVIVVDDCDPADSLYDGAGQAYREFCDTYNITQEIAHEKLGVIRKPSV
jgi:O-methyltransferase